MPVYCAMLAFFPLASELISLRLICLSLVTSSPVLTIMEMETHTVSAGHARVHIPAAQAGMVQTVVDVSFSLFGCPDSGNGNRNR